MKYGYVKTNSPQCESLTRMCPLFKKRGGKSKLPDRPPLYLKRGNEGALILGEIK